MQRCLAPRLGRTPQPNPPLQLRLRLQLRLQLQQPQLQQCRTIKHDPEPARRRYLEQIHLGLDDASLTVDPVAKTVSTAAGPLPISPLMDPDWLEATRRWRHEPKKPEGTTPMGRFRKKMAKNPYALALATPIRRCVKTNLPIPRYFLQSFGIIHNPETVSNWWTPKDLAFQVPREVDEDEDGSATDRQKEDAPIPAPDPSEEVAESSEDQDDDALLDGEQSDFFSNPDDVADDDYTTPPEPSPTATASDPSPDLPDLPEPSPDSATQPTLAKVITRRYDPSAYLLLRQATIRPDTKRRWTLRIGLPNWAGASARAVMREDMDEFVLHLRRRQIVATLLYFARLHVGEDRQYLSPCASWSKAQEYTFRGCLLWTRPSETMTTTTTTTTTTPPGPCITYDVLPGEQFDSRIPVHNLHYLLGEEFVAELRRESPLFRDNWLFMLGRRRSVELQMQLWQLQGFLLEPWPGSNITRL